ncbi:MAG TPA: hypothetical protein VIY48_02995 [Candidatus Paceibacterota bacterium]
MYSPRVVLQNLDEFARREGWMPVPHSMDEINEFSEFIKSITETKSNTRSINVGLSKEITKKTATEIRRFVENEQAMCAMDCSYWEDRYAWVCDEKGMIFKFKNRRGQEILDRIIGDFEEDGVSIELLVLKARQLGISTKAAIKFLHRLMFFPFTQGVMASVQDDKSQLISRMIRVCLQRQPWWLIPGVTSRSTEIIGFDNDSIMSIQSGKQATGIAQGWTPTLVHISELAEFPKPKVTLEEGLFKAVHSSRRLLMILEGTGKGNTGWFADKWRATKEDWPKGRARFCPVFLSWPLSPDLYPQADWLRKYPIPEGWEPRVATRAHVRKCELYIRNTEYISRVVGADWKMPREQQWFWEFNYDEAVKSHTEKVWMSQMPADDKEALVGQNDLVFDDSVIEVASEERKRDYEVYGIMGETIDEGLEPAEDEIDYNKDRILVKWKSHRGTEFEWQLVPLRRFDESDERQALGKVLIYEHPQDGYDYTFGIDTAEGLGKDDEDRSVLSGTHSVSGDNCDEQVLELCSNRINAPQMVGFIACLAAYYGKRTKDPRGVKLCIEQRMRYGDDCQLQLKFMGFRFFHQMIWYDRKTVRENESVIEGWRTAGWSRPLLLNRFVDAVNNGWYKPHSLGLIGELANFERTTLAGKTKLIAQTGKKDDRIFAAAMSYFSRHHLESLAERQQKRYSKPTGRLPQMDHSVPTTNQISVGEW